MIFPASHEGREAKAKYAQTFIAHPFLVNFHSRRNKNECKLDWRNGMGNLGCEVMKRVIEVMTTRLSRGWKIHTCIEFGVRAKDALEHEITTNSL